jgi:hypothetical protein
MQEARSPPTTEAPLPGAPQKKRKQRSKKPKTSEKSTTQVHSAADIAAIVSGVPPGSVAPIPVGSDPDAAYLYNEEKAADDKIAKVLEKLKNPALPSKKHKKKKPKKPAVKPEDKAASATTALPPPTHEALEEVPPAPVEEDIWYKEQGIFHDFMPQCVEAQIMAAQIKTRGLARQIMGYTDAVINQAREYGAMVSRTLAESDEVSLERIEAFEAINMDLKKNLRTIGIGLENCALALYSLNTTSKALNSKHRALFRNIRSHLYNSYIFDANTPGSSLLLDPSVPQ